MGGVMIFDGPVSDWKEYFPGEKGEEMNREQRRVAQLPWGLTQTGGCHYKYDEQNKKNLSQKTDCYTQHKEGTGTYGHLIPHTIVDYKNGIPSVVRVYNAEENHALFQQQKFHSGMFDPNDPKDALKLEHNHSFFDNYSAYSPVVTYYLPDQLHWSHLKNEENTSVIASAVEEFIAASEMTEGAMIDIVQFKDPNKKKGFLMNLNELLHPNKEKPAAPVVIKRVREDIQAIEYR